jgi:hypothetical protein
VQAAGFCEQPGYNMYRRSGKDPLWLMCNKKPVRLADPARDKGYPGSARLFQGQEPCNPAAWIRIKHTDRMSVFQTAPGRTEPVHSPANNQVHSHPRHKYKDILLK